MMPFGIVACALMLLLDNLSRNSSFSSPEPRIDPRLWETLCRRTCAVGFLEPKIGYLNLTAPAQSSGQHECTNAFDCSLRKPIRGHFVSGFPRALLSLGQEKSSGVEIGNSCIQGPLAAAISLLAVSPNALNP